MATKKKQDYAANIERAKKATAAAKSNPKKNTDTGSSEWRNRATSSFKAFQNDQIKKSQTFYNITGATRNGTDNSSKLTSKYFVSDTTKKKYLDQTKYSYTGKKDEELNLAEVIARASRDGSISSYQPYLEEAILDPTSRFYNPYFGKRPVQSSKAETFLREYFGGYDGEFDEKFFEQTADILQYSSGLRNSNTGTGIQSPGSKGTPEQWAAYYWIQLQNDMSKQRAVDEEWNDLRSKMQSAYKEHATVFGNAPSYEELMSYIDMSDYTNLKKIDDSRNLDWGTSAAPVELNKGTWYSQEALAGVYNALSQGKDVSEDRDYFGDAVEHYAQPMREAAARTGLLQERGIDTSDWTDERYETEMSAARAAGDMELFDTLKSAHYAATPKMGSLADDVDYITPRFGAYISDAAFDAIESVYGSYWPKMMDADGNVKKPSSKDDMVYHAAYQAWEIFSKKEFTQAAENESDAFQKAIADLSEYKEDFSDFDTFEAYARGILEDGNYDNLSDYLKDESKSARTLQINDEFISKIIKDVWDGTAEEVSDTEAVDNSIMEVDDGEVEDAPLFYDEEVQQREQSSALKQKEDEIELSTSLAALSASETPISTSQIVDSGLPVAPVAVMEDPELLAATAALWNQSGLGRGDASDPVVKMLTGGVESEEVALTIGDVFNLATIRDVAHIAGEKLSVFDGVLAGAINDVDAFYSAVTAKFGNLDYKAYINALGSTFNVKHYNNAYNRAKESGYEGENAAIAALDAMVYGSDEFDKMAATAQGDEVLEAATQTLTESLVTEEGYIDSVETIAPIFEESVLDEDVEISYLTKEVSGAMLLGMSQKATPEFQNATKEIVNDIAHGDITSQDVKDGLNDYLNRVKANWNTAVDTMKQNKGDLLSVLGMSGYSVGTEKYDALSDEDKANADKIWNQSSSAVTNKNEIMFSILAHAAKDGHAEHYGTGETKSYLDNKAVNNLTSNDFMMWLGTATGVVGDTAQEMYKVRNDLYNYGKWFTYDEAYALRTAWETGFITYDSLHDIVVDRVSQYSREYLNGVANADEISRGVQTANSAIDEIEASINHNLEVQANAISDEVIGGAKSALNYIHQMHDPVTTVQSDDALAAAIGLDAIIAENGSDEALLMFAIEDALTGLIENGEMQSVVDDNSGYDYTLDQTEELRKLVNLYEQFGAYGSDMLVYAEADPSFLKQYGVDLEGVGLEGSAIDYMDDLTGMTWRNAYGDEGIGLLASANNGLLQGIQSVGNVPAVLGKWAKEIFTDYEYKEGDETYYDELTQVTGQVENRMEAKATGFEKFAAGILREYSSNQITGIIGAAVGAMVDSARYSKYTADAIKSLGKNASPEDILNLASASFNATRAIDATKIISRLPFATKVFASSYEQYADGSRSTMAATARAAINVAIELFTETAAVDDRLNAIRSRIIPGLDAVSDADVCFITKLTGDAFNEIGQEELSLGMGRLVDIFENYDASKANDVASFFSELKNSILTSTEGMGEEAVVTAISTFFTTLLGTATTYNGSNTKKMLDRKRMNGEAVTAAELETIAKVAVDDIANGASDGNEKVSRKSDLATGIESVIRGDDNGENLESDIAASMNPEPKVSEAEEQPVEETVEKASNEEPAQQPSLPAPDPSLTPGAAKISVYAENADQNKADAIGKQVEESTFEEMMAEDPGIASAQKSVDTATEKVGVVSQTLENIRTSIQNKKRQLGMIFSASFGEGVAFNSPSVQNSVAANQQETAALENDASKTEEDLQAAERELKKAETSLEEAQSKAEKIYRPQAQSAGKEATIAWLDRRDVWRKENEKERLRSNTAALESEAIRQGVGYKRDGEENASTEDGEHSMYTKLTKPAPSSKSGEINTYDEKLGSEYDEISGNEMTKTDDAENSFDRQFAEMDENDKYDMMETGDGKNRKQKGRTVSNADLTQFFDYTFTNLYDVFKNYSRQSKVDRADYMVPVSAKLHHMLLGFFDRAKNGEQYKKLFLSDSDYADPASKKTTAYKDANIRVSESGEEIREEVDVETSADRKKGVNVKDRTKMDYLYLASHLGLKPVAESADEVIINVSGTDRGTTELTQNYVAKIEKAKRDYAEAGRILREKDAALKSTQGIAGRSSVKAVAAPINSFRNEHSFLSNFHDVPIEIDGIVYRNAEAAFQAQKCVDPSEKAKFANMSGKEAKSAGKRVALRSDWEDVKLDVMRSVIDAKFRQNPELSEKLIATGDAELIEGNSWGDRFWGVDSKTNNGNNALGRILMEVRASLSGKPVASPNNIQNKSSVRDAIREYNIAFDNYNYAECNLRVAQKAYQMAKDSEQDAFEVYSKADVREALDRFDAARSLVDENARKRTEYMRTSMSPLELQQEAKAVTDYEGINEEAVRSHNEWIERASLATGAAKEELLAYIDEKYRDAEYAKYRDSILASLQTKHLKDRNALKAYLVENGGWTTETGGKSFDNLETNKTYYAHAGLISAIHRYSNQFSKAGINLAKMSKGQIDEAITKLVSISDKLQATEAMGVDWQKANARAAVLGMNDVVTGAGYTYAPVDVSASGTLKANIKVANANILNANDQYSVEQAVTCIKEAYASLRKEPKENPYYIWVQVGDEKRKVGAWQKDLNRRYYPSMEELFDSGVTIRMFHKNESGQRDIDFVFEPSKDEGRDAVQKQVEEAARSLNDLLSGTDSSVTPEQAKVFATRYLEASLKRMQYELNGIVSEFRHNGRNWEANYAGSADNYIKSLRDGIGQIERALKNDKLLGQYLSEMDYNESDGLSSANAAALGKQLIQSYATKLNRKYKPDSPEVQAVAAVAETISDDSSKEKQHTDDRIIKNAVKKISAKLKNPGKNYPDVDSILDERISLRTLMGTDHALKGENRVLQRLNLRMDDLLTEGMTDEEKIDYYTRRAEEAERVDADKWRFDEYQKRILDAAGVSENSDVAQENETETSGEEVVDESIAIDETASTPTVTSNDEASDDAQEENILDPETEVNIPDAEDAIEAEEDPEVKAALEDMRDAGNTDEEAASFEINDSLFITVNRRGKPVVDEARFAEAQAALEAQVADLETAQADLDAAFANMQSRRDDAAAYLTTQKQLKDLKAKFKKLERETPEWYETRDAINRIHKENIVDSDGRKAHQAYVDAIKAKDEAVQKRDALKKLINNNRKKLYGNKVVSGYLKNRSFGSAYGTVYGTASSPVQFARSVLNDLKKSGWQYGNLTHKSREQLAEAVAARIDEKMYENNRAAALHISETVREFELKAAEYEYENALILKRIAGLKNAEKDDAVRLADAKKADDRILEARRNLFKVYKSVVTKETNTEADLAKYRQQIKIQVEKASDIALKLAEKYQEAGHTLESLSARSAKLSNMETGYIAELRNAATEMAVSRDALFDTSMKVDKDSESGTYDAITGKYGGRMPVHMVDLVLGIILDVSEGKTSKDKAKVRAGMTDLLSATGATRSEVDMVSEAYENHYTFDQIASKFGDKGERVNELMGIVNAERSKLLGKFSNPAAIISKNFDAPERTIDLFFGDYAPIIKTLLYDPARDAERKQDIEFKQKMKQLRRDRLNKEQRAYAHRAIHEGYSDKQIAEDRPKDYAAIKRTIDTAKDIFRETGVALNIAEKRNGLELTNLIENYAHTFKDGESNWILKLLDLSRSDNALPIELIGKTGEFSPIHKYMSSHEHREGNSTDFDIYKSVEKYLPAVLNTIYQTDNVVRMKQISEALEGVNRGEKGENMSFDYDQNGNHIGGRMVYFKEWLDRISKNATGKASDIDREAEAKYGRNIRTWTNAIKKYRTLALLAGNYRSAMTNTLVLAKVASLHPVATFTSLCATMAQVFGYKDKHNAYMKQNSLRYQARSGMSEEERPAGAAATLAIAPAEFIDKFATSVLQRTLYVSELNNSPTKAHALAQAEDIASRLQADKTKLTRPELFNSNIASTILQFTQESVNDLMFSVKDMPKYAGSNPAKYIAQLLFGYLLYSVYNDIFNANSISDPLGAAYRAVNNRKEGDSVVKTGIDVATSMADTLNPFSNIVEEGFEGIPVIGGAKKIGTEFLDAVTDPASVEEWMQFGAALLGFVPGGTQIQRTVGGIQDVSRGYATTQDGKVKYAIDASPAKYAIATVFGSGSLSDANEYYNSNYSGSMSGSNAEMFKSMVGEAKKNGVLPSDLFRSIKANSDAKAKTSEADKVNKRADSTKEERKAANDAAKEARKDVTIPDGLASWAQEEALAGDPSNVVSVGIDLYRTYGVKTYPTEFSVGSTVTGENGEETKYNSYDGVEYPTDASVYEAMNSAMKVSYKRLLKDYANGKYGTPNTQIAAENLESALTKEKNRIKKLHMGAVAENFGGDMNG